MKVNYEKLIEFLQVSARWISDKNNAKTKLGYAIERVRKNCKRHIDAYNEAVQDLQVDNAATDDKGVLLTEENGAYKYTREGMKNLNKAIRELRKKDVEVEVYHASELPEELSDEMKEVFDGFVIKETIEQ